MQITPYYKEQMSTGDKRQMRADRQESKSINSLTIEQLDS